MASNKALYICIIVLITICSVSAGRRNTKLEYQEAFPNVDNIFLPVDMDTYAGNIYVTSLLGQVYKFANSDTVRQNQVYTFFDINLVTANGFKFFTNGFDGGDEGLTSIEFHPNFPTVPKFYAFYTATNTSIQIAAFTVGNAGVNYNSVDILLTIPKPLAHQIVQPYGILYEAYLGGDLRFHAEDSDDDDDDCHDNIQNLYISVGFANKPGSAQSSTSYLGKILRVTPRTSGSGYTIPNTNPRINNQPSIIWARGLRNPRKINFADDPDNLFCADVGDVYDEINVIAKSKNYGYEVVEGCSNSNLYTNPVYDYTSDDAHAITGGPYYPSGGSFKTIREKMLFADLYLGTLYALQSSNVGNPRCDKTPVVVATPPSGTQILISSILVVGNDVIINNVIGAAYGLPTFYRLVEVEA